MNPRTILVLSGWYPSVDGLASGRFVADQVTALQAAGRFRPIVVSFDPLPTWGSRGLRLRERAAVRELASRGLGEPVDAVFRERSAVSGAPGPVARLPVPGPDAGSGPEAAVADRLAALDAALPAITAVAGEIALIHAHTGLPDGVAGARLARRLGVPLVLTEHASTLPSIAADPARRALYREALAASSAVLAVSGSLAAEITALDASITPRLAVVGNVVAVDDFALPLAGTRTPGELLFVGFRKPSKGIAVLLEAFGRVLAARPGVRLRLIGAPGSPGDERRWRSQAAALGIAPAVSFEPEADRRAVAAAMQRADVFVHPSSRETFGVVAAEALASGLPVVAADSGGVSEVLGRDPDRNGRLVPRDDPVAMAEAILDVLARRGEFREEALRRGVVGRFGPAAIAGRLGATYDAALARAAQPTAARASFSKVLAPARASIRAGRPDAPTPAESGTASDAAALSGTILVIGSDRTRAARILGSMPAHVRSRVVLVTADGPAPDLPVGLAGIHLVDGLGSRYAARRAIRDAPGSDSVARRRLLRRRPLVALRELAWRIAWRERALVHSAAAAADAAAGVGEELVVAGLDAFDALVAWRLVQLGHARPLPGAGRWLADAAGSPGTVDDPAT